MKRKRSIRAKAVEHLLSLYFKDTTYEKEIEKLEGLSARGEKTYQVPKWLKLKSNLEKETVDGMPVYYLHKNQKREILILYIHGGAYVDEFLTFHWRFMDSLAQKLGAVIAAPDYGLAPFHTYDEAYEKIRILYQKMRMKYQDKKIIFMGDSAGGGLALGIIQELVRAREAAPEGMVLISPWADASMDNPEICRFEKEDPMLKTPRLLACVSYWAKGLDLHDPKISPLYGDMEQLPPTLILTGTRETFYFDACKLRKKMKDSGVRVMFRSGKEMNHVYPLYPIPEAKIAMEDIISFCRKL